MHTNHDLECWYAYKTEQERKEDPLDDDYVPEEYRTKKE